MWGVINLKIIHIRTINILGNVFRFQPRISSNLGKAWRSLHDRPQNSYRQRHLRVSLQRIFLLTRLPRLDKNYQTKPKNSSHKLNPLFTQPSIRNGLLLKQFERKVNAAVSVVLSQWNTQNLHLTRPHSARSAKTIQTAHRRNVLLKR